MKALLLVLAAIFIAGCDVEKLTSVQSPDATPPPTPVATPKPTPKPGDWMLKNYKNPLDGKK